MDAAETNKLYKEEKKIEKERLKRLKMVEKRQASLEATRQAARAREKATIDAKFERTMLAYRKMQQKQLDKKTREIK